MRQPAPTDVGCTPNAVKHSKVQYSKGESPLLSSPAVLLDKSKLYPQDLCEATFNFRTGMTAAVSCQMCQSLYGQMRRPPENMEKLMTVFCVNCVPTVRMRL